MMVKLCRVKRFTEIESKFPTLGEWFPSMKLLKSFDEPSTRLKESNLIKIVLPELEVAIQSSAEAVRHFTAALSSWQMLLTSCNVVFRTRHSLAFQRSICQKSRKAA